MNTFPKPYTQAEEKEAFLKMKQGDVSAREGLILHNLRLVTHVIKHYNISEADTAEYISIGTIGLIKAIDSFDDSQGTRLATYASRCINNEILMHLRVSKKLNREMSYNETVGTDKEGNEIHLFDVLESTEPIPQEKYIHSWELGKISEAVEKCLTSREKVIIRLRYGFENKAPLTQKEIASMFKISRSYVSRIEKKALEKIRKYCDM
ncbi:MAG: RNA polymerase sporulation sigma factor SigK [Clostridiales bacterium]|nr:RNA polymerase sporulation sigma factor SigK [Clostridiales bacterium]